MFRPKRKGRLSEFSGGKNREYNEIKGFLQLSHIKGEATSSLLAASSWEVLRKGLMMGLQYTNDSIGPRIIYQLAQNDVMAIYTVSNNRG